MNTETMRERLYKKFNRLNDISPEWDDNGVASFPELEIFIESEIKDAITKEREEVVVLIESFRIIANRTEDDELAKALTDVTYPMIKEKLIAAISKRPL